MAIALTLDVDEQYALLPQLWRYQFDIPSVAGAASSPVYEIPTRANEGRLVYVRISYTGVVDTTFHIYRRDTPTRGSVDEIFRVTPVNLCFTGQLPCDGIPFTNTDGEKCDTQLYFDVDNLGVVATGDITVELHIQHEGQS